MSQRSYRILAVMFLLLFFQETNIAAHADNFGLPLKAAQIRKAIVGKNWEASWGPFHSVVIFGTDGHFRNGLGQDSRWRFDGNQIAIARDWHGTQIEDRLNFYVNGNDVIATVVVGGQELLSYHGPTP